MSQYTVLVTKVIDRNSMVQISGTFEMDEPTMQEIIDALQIIIDEGEQK